VSFKTKKSLAIVTPKEGRTFKNTKVIAGCQMAVKNKLSAFSLDGEGHQHQRYRISITATYPERSSSGRRSRREERRRSRMTPESTPTSTSVRNVS